MGYLLIVILIMAILSLILNFIGKKISYSYILYTPPISLSVGICLYLVKLFNIDYPVEGFSIIFDLLVLTALITVWIFAIIETIIIDVIEQGPEIKDDFSYLGKKLVTLCKLAVERMKSKHTKLEPFELMEEETVENVEKREKVTQK
ncbi:hypothetical protein [Ureibacillus endophyticus]|uniref:Uncharacterized protein n=1 Tax=Ureibacillus endophyticus TaxID=1978490 RepID=A0A494Z7B2_9BACL|nr:hypothetical protein [Lysinibacillus endophyticus]RKQ18488.1 hypothetical protein D8M03_05430 [Lysinibacillus endophyticus]